MYCIWFYDCLEAEITLIGALLPFLKKVLTRMGSFDENFPREKRTFVML